MRHTGNPGRLGGSSHQRRGMARRLKGDWTRFGSFWEDRNKNSNGGSARKPPLRSAMCWIILRGLAAAEDDREASKTNPEQDEGGRLRNSSGSTASDRRAVDLPQKLRGRPTALA